MFSEDLQFTFSFLSMMYPLILLWIPGDAKSTPKLGKGKEAFRKRKERKERKGNCFHYFPHQTNVGKAIISRPFGNGFYPYKK